MGIGNSVVDPDPKLFASAELEPDPECILKPVPDPISNRMTKVLTGTVLNFLGKSKK
jgi:hypothetical protein